MKKLRHRLTGLLWGDRRIRGPAWLSLCFLFLAFFSFEFPFLAVRERVYTFRQIFHEVGYDNMFRSLLIGLALTAPLCLLGLRFPAFVFGAVPVTVFACAAGAMASAVGLEVLVPHLGPGAWMLFSGLAGHLLTLLLPLPDSFLTARLLAFWDSRALDFPGGR